MATSLLEKTRALHEDVERCQRMIVQLRMEEPKTVLRLPPPDHDALFLALVVSFSYNQS
jgi:hypothetical protein